MEKPSGYIALLDSSVLFPVFTSNLILWLAYRQIYQPRWTLEIHEEWVERRLTRYPDASRAALERKRDRMDKEFEEALVTGYEPLIETLSFKRDPNDRHVLAAAIFCKAAVIVTNDRDFECSVAMTICLQLPLVAACLPPSTTTSDFGHF